MRTADFVSLFQLGVALNLGFGALISFGEPLKQRISRAIGEGEMVLEDLIEHKNTNAAEVEPVFEVGRLYLDVRHAYYDTAKQWEFVDWHFVHIAIVCSAIVSFFGLFFCSVEPGVEVGYIVVLIVLLCNAVPITIALVHLMLAFQLRLTVYPKLVVFQNLLRATYFRLNMFGSLKQEIDFLEYSGSTSSVGKSRM